MLWGLTVFAGLKAAIGFSEQEKPDDVGAEGYNRLLTILSKNKYGYNTRFMSDFDLFLEALFNQRFIDESTLYYDDVTTEKEITDMEAGLNSDFARADVRHMLRTETPPPMNLSRLSASPTALEPTTPSLTTSPATKFCPRVSAPLCEHRAPCRETAIRPFNPIAFAFSCLSI